MILSGIKVPDVTPLPMWLSIGQGIMGYPAVQLWLTNDQIRTGSESRNVKYGAKGKK